MRSQWQATHAVNKDMTGKSQVIAWMAQHREVCTEPGTGVLRKDFRLFFLSAAAAWFRHFH